MNIKLPNITGTTPNEKLIQMQSYLFQLVGELQWALNTIEKNTPSVPAQVQAAATPKPVAQEAKAQDNFNEIKSLIIKSADIVQSYYAEINNLLKLSGEYVAESDFGTYTEKTDAAIDASDKRLKSIVGRTETIEGDMRTVKQSQTTLEQDADKVQATVQKIVEEGATKVVTTTGHKLTDEGLTVFKSGKPTETTITEDGMYVKRTDMGQDAAEEEKTMLKANKDGVEAKNLEASTYLIVGGRCRLEKFGTDRIGCFWVG